MASIDQELGTSRMQAQPFMAPAVEEHRDSVKERVEHYGLTRLDEAVRSLAFDIAATAQDLAPFEFGGLRNSIAISKEQPA